MSIEAEDTTGSAAQMSSASERQAVGVGTANRLRSDQPLHQPAPLRTSFHDPLRLTTAAAGLGLTGAATRRVAKLEFKKKKSKEF